MGDKTASVAFSLLGGELALFLVQAGAFIGLALCVAGPVADVVMRDIDVLVVVEDMDLAIVVDRDVAVVIVVVASTIAPVASIVIGKPPGT